MFTCGLYGPKNEGYKNKCLFWFFREALRLRDSIEAVPPPLSGWSQLACSMHSGGSGMLESVDNAGWPVISSEASSLIIINDFIFFVHLNQTVVLCALLSKDKGKEVWQSG